MLHPRLLFWRLFGRSRYLELIFYRALCDLRVDASRNFIGILWWVVEPVLYMATFYLVFAVGFRAGGEDFVPYLLTGLVPWKWFASTVQGGSSALMNNKGLMEQVYLPKHVLVGIILVSNTVKFFIILSLLLLFLVLYGYSPGMTWLLVPFVMLVQMVLMLALAGLGASLLPFLPDLRLIIDNGIMMMFFASAIFYEVESRSEEVQYLLQFNPMLQVIESYRDLLIRDSLPDVQPLAIIVLASFATMGVAYAMLSRFDRVYPKIVI